MIPKITPSVDTLDDFDSHVESVRAMKHVHMQLVQHKLSNHDICVVLAVALCAAFEAYQNKMPANSIDTVNKALEEVNKLFS